jgi:hypothetical protein
LKEKAMHHYGESAVEVNVSSTTFMVVLTNHVTGAKITITGPVTGVFEDPTRRIDVNEVRKMGDEIAHLLRNIL